MRKRKILCRSCALLVKEGLHPPRMADCLGCSYLANYGRPREEMLERRAQQRVVSARNAKMSRIAWVKKNRARVNAIARACYWRNREKLLARQKEWRSKNKVWLQSYRKKYGSIYYRKNRKALLAKYKEYRARVGRKRPDPLKKSAWDKKYNIKHRDRIKKMRHAFYVRNREQILAKTGAYRRANLARSNELSKARYRRNLEKRRYSSAQHALRKKYGPLAPARRVLINLKRTLKTIKKGDKNEGTQRRINRPSKRKDATRSASASA